MADENKKKISDRELISGRIYSREPINEDISEKAEYFSEIFNNYAETRNKDIKINDPFESITLDRASNTIIRPILAIQNEESTSQIDWVVDYAKNDRDILAFCIKPVVFLEAGISEYWVIDIEDKTIVIYHLKKNGFIPEIVTSPRRIKVETINSLLLNYSDIFREKW